MALIREATEVSTFPGFMSLNLLFTSISLEEKSL